MPLLEPPDQAESTKDLLVVDRIERKLREILRSPGQQAGSKLPHERDLATEYGVSRRSIREAIVRLKRDRLLRAVPGKGTFIISSVKQRTGVVLFNNDSLHSYNLMCIGVLSDVLRKRGHSPILVSSSDPAAEWDSVMSDHGDAVGAVLIGVYRREIIARLVKQCDRPVVLVSEMEEQYHGKTLCNTVVNDGPALVFAAVEHLLKQGHRRIALLGWDFSWVWTRDSQRGYEDALRSHGIEPNPDWIVDLPSESTGKSNPEKLKADIEAVRVRARRWAAGNDGPTAVIHTAGDEARMRDVLESYFLGRFRGDQILAATFRETLETSYTSMFDATAIASRFEDVANRATDLLLEERKKGAAPTRETLGRIFVCKREHGVWHDEES